MSSFQRFLRYAFIRIWGTLLLSVCHSKFQFNLKHRSLMKLAFYPDFTPHKIYKPLCNTQSQTGSLYPVHPFTAAEGLK